MQSSKLIGMYIHAYEVVSNSEHAWELDWAMSLKPGEFDEKMFLSEHAYVAMCSGMRQSIVRVIYPKIEKVFYGFESSNKIVNNADICYNNAIALFKHKQKINGIIDASRMVDREGFDNLKVRICENPLEVLVEFPFIGDITKYHLAKNIGFYFAKPDRHLVRMASVFGMDTKTLCNTIAELIGERVPVVDSVLWRYATLDEDYMETLKKYAN
jgi:hypothetical protein